MNDNKIIIIIDENGNIIKRIPLEKISSGLCNFYNFNIKGNYSNFDNYRKFNLKNDIFISPSYPSISVRMAMICGSRRITVIENILADNMKEWNHLTLNVKWEDKKTKIQFFLNGIKKSERILDGLYKIYYGESTSPFVIGGYSGKILPLNLEKGIPNNFFKGFISNLNIFNDSLTEFEVKALSMQRHYNKWKDMELMIPIPSTTKFECIDKLFINRYKGYKSNRFNIKIKNFTDNIELQDLMKSYISDNIQKLIPVNTTLQDVIFE